MIYTKDIIEKKKKKIENRKKITSIILKVLIFVIIIYNFGVIATSIIKPNKTPSFLGIKTFVILSGSMEPNLKIGDIAIVEECKQEDLKVDDIISFREGQVIVTHRIIEIRNTDTEVKYITKGDNNNTEDTNPVVFENIEGVYKTRIKYVGNLILFLKNKIAIIVIILICFVIYNQDVKKERKAKIRSLKREEYEKNKVI